MILQNFHVKFANLLLFPYLRVRLKYDYLFILELGCQCDIGYYQIDISSNEFIPECTPCGDVNYLFKFEF